MVTIEKKDKSNYLISLSPNSSLEGIARIIFLASITFVCGGIAIIFYFFGAFMILPFAGIELTILFIAFYLSFKWRVKVKIRFRNHQELPHPFLIKIRNKLHAPLTKSLNSKIMYQKKRKKKTKTVRRKCVS